MSGSRSGYSSRTAAIPALYKTQAAWVGGPWREINLAQTDGRNFAQKLESIMSCLMPDRTTTDAAI